MKYRLAPTFNSSMTLWPYMKEAITTTIVSARRPHARYSRQSHRALDTATTSLMKVSERPRNALDNVSNDLSYV